MAQGASEQKGIKKVQLRNFEERKKRAREIVCADGERAKLIFSLAPEEEKRERKREARAGEAKWVRIEKMKKYRKYPALIQSVRSDIFCQ